MHDGSALAVAIAEPDKYPQTMTAHLRLSLKIGPL
jgi:hypothetical protein